MIQRLAEQDTHRPETRSENIWVVVPAYNEGSRVAKTLASLRTRFANVVVVDDGSSDATARVAGECPGVWVLSHVINSGQGAALQTGIDFALQHDADVIVTFDADGQHAVEDIDLLVQPILSDEADVALGSRFLGRTVGMPLSRRLLLKGAVVFTRVFSRIRVTDTHNGIRALSRRAAKAIRISLNRMAHASEILDQIRKHQLRYVEVPVTIHYSDETLEKGQGAWNSIRIVGHLFLSRLIK